MDSPLFQKMVTKTTALQLSCALAEDLDIRTLKAAESILNKKAMKSLAFFSPQKKILALAQKEGVDLEKHKNNIIWASEEIKDIASQTAEHIQDLFKARRKTISDDHANKMGHSPLFQSAYLLSKDIVQTSVAGAAHTTGEIIKAGIQGVGLAEGVKTVSGSFIMEKPETNQTFIYADSGVVIQPTKEQLVDIAFESVKTWNKVLSHLGEPVVAFLSFSTKGSATHENVNLVNSAANMFKEIMPEIKSDGELQFDAAFSQSVGRRKAPDSPVPGKANIFIFPNLDAGNIAYKITQRLAGFGAYGLILQGLAKPYSDLSRGASPHDIEASVYINALRSQP